MNLMSKSPKALIMAAMLVAPVTASYAQYEDNGDVAATVYGERIPNRANMTEGPDVDGIISARMGDKMQVTMADGTQTVITIDDQTEIMSKGGFLGLASKDRAASSLFNGLPVSVKTLQYANGLMADEIKFKTDDLKTASMIHNGTNQRFTKNEAATEALRGRMGDIDQYNIKGTTEVYFDTGKWNLSAADQQKLCSTASQASAMDNALLLVVGYTDSVGDQDYNQELSEKRAGRVVNYLQQACGWKPYRMLTPTGMAEADPAADNSTEEGKAQNRRVAVNVLVSKSVDGL
ncbi:OmpA family protein [Croceicoccus naphthovorans]|uniref:OmpA family protein n=1 Tax=Croceicoccus naphthovorans TaxID=1348774 RepID=A0A0G3XIF5_9SPHN|nr:OmpA family protein [Croceicoccus naphthovorans]AKM10401.1 OmpA family protein [Croceicoccus naphthovorans]MBB3990101.1 outer membrane protein OmpA-like peptidoglycan-associated protein [Croceicoccus naphthovorans]